jgi:hypothetical protein
MNLKMMNENRAFYVAAVADTASGEAELNKKIKSVIDNLPDTFKDLTGEKIFFRYSFFVYKDLKKQIKSLQTTNIL